MFVCMYGLSCFLKDLLGFRMDNGLRMGFKTVSWKENVINVFCCFVG